MELEKLKAELKKARVTDSNIEKYAPVLSELMPSYGIDTPLRQRHFLAQLLCESGGFYAVRENLNYSTDGLLSVFRKYFPTRDEAENFARLPEKIANRVYGGRIGNGSEASGDGWKFIGRGLIQITGRMNYSLVSKALFGDERLLEKPEMLEEPRYAVESGCWYWQSNNLNLYADKNDLLTVTKRINGSTNGLEIRQSYYNDLKGITA
jgi:putative chitinase